MQTTYLFISIIYLLHSVYCANPPTLDELCGNWVGMERQRDPPVISNFQGSVAAGEIQTK